MVCSMSTTAFAATNDWTHGTQVVYNGTGTESYTITVPALLKPGQSGTVTLSGAWAKDRIVTVTADKNVTLTNSILSSDQKVLDVTFAGISETGSNTGAQTFTESVSVQEITNALFGVWNGKFNYNVEMSNARAEISVSAKDQNGNDLNAQAFVIAGAEKDELITQLKASDLVDENTEVDALIEVKSDDFEDFADTTFDVSSIAQAGDKVVILHYNEETREWEYVSEETVDAEGKINADFESYSPVAFVVVKPDGTIVPITPQGNIVDNSWPISWNPTQIQGNTTMTDGEYIKVSDLVPSKAELESSRIRATVDGEEIIGTCLATQQIGDAVGAVYTNGTMLFFVVSVPTPGNYDYDGETIYVSEPGLYVDNLSDIDTTITLEQVSTETVMFKHTKYIDRYINPNSGVDESRYVWFTDDSFVVLYLADDSHNLGPVNIYYSGQKAYAIDDNGEKTNIAIGHFSADGTLFYMYNFLAPTEEVIWVFDING